MSEFQEISELTQFISYKSTLEQNRLKPDDIVIETKEIGLSNKSHDKVYLKFKLIDNK